MMFNLTRTADKNLDQYPYKAVLTIDGMMCGACTAQVENALNSLEPYTVAKIERTVSK